MKKVVACCRYAASDSCLRSSGKTALDVVPAERREDAVDSHLERRYFGLSNISTGPLPKIIDQCIWSASIISNT
jgi:hypothetical protein